MIRGTKVCGRLTPIPLRRMHSLDAVQSRAIGAIAYDGGGRCL
jgi:hypothetical protein